MLNSSTSDLHRAVQTPMAMRVAGRQTGIRQLTRKSPKGAVLGLRLWSVGRGGSMQLHHDNGQDDRWPLERSQARRARYDRLDEHAPPTRRQRAARPWQKPLDAHVKPIAAGKFCFEPASDHLCCSRACGGAPVCRPNSPRCARSPCRHKTRTENAAAIMKGSGVRHRPDGP